MILSLIAFSCLLGGVFMLIMLSWTDLKTRLLPNEMVLGFATLGIVFHITTISRFLFPVEILLGGVIGFTILYLVRAAANYIYQQDALGLGDVKLIGAAGIWLGPDMVMMALSLGAMAALLHGVGYALWQGKKTGTIPPFATLQIPAGPGFAAGIIATGLYKFHSFNLFSSPDYIPGLY